MKYIVKICLLFVFAAFYSQAQAQTRLTVEGSSRLYPIAIPQLCSKTPNANAIEVARIISKDLTMSGYFEVLNSESYIEDSGKCQTATDFAYSDWSILGVDGLVKGEIIEEADKLTVKLYLHDVQIQKMELAKEYTGSIKHLRPIAHKFSNEILKYFTGTFGPFGTKVVFSQKMGRFKELFVMDLDGENLRQLTKENALAMSSSWSTDNRWILFNNFRNRQPDLFKVELENRRITQLTNTVVQELGAKVHPNGQEIIFSKSEGLKSDLNLMNLETKKTRKVTRNYSTIDVSPDWSPDGNRLTFCSNRSGGPQIYTMDKDGNNVKRISYVSSNYCTSPVWSPRGDKIAYVCRSENRHHLFVSNADGTQPIQLTATGSNEDPSWSPDGRYLLFASTAFSRAYNLAMIRLDGAQLTQITFSTGGSFDPAWSGWLN